MSIRNVAKRYRGFIVRCVDGDESNVFTGRLYLCVGLYGDGYLILRDSKGQLISGMHMLRFNNI